MRTDSQMIALVLCICCGEIAWGQRLTVQQPVCRRFSVHSTVVVPDRGAAFLGGVSRAGEARQRFGPCGCGPSTGMTREYSGVSVRVWIHDLREMDRVILNQASTGSPPTSGESDGSARWKHAYETLIARGATRPVRPVDAPSTDSARADRFLRLGLAAEERGDVQVASLHYRMAQKHGSMLAAERLKSLTSN